MVCVPLFEQFATHESQRGGEWNRNDFLYTQREWCKDEIENETNIGEGLNSLLSLLIDAEENLLSHTSSS